MSDSSRGRITITLGRGGQVVKRELSDVESPSVTGAKRSVRDRLGASADSEVLHGRQLDNKRQRSDSSASSVSSNVSGGSHIRKDDLRYKLMKKNMAKRAQDNHHKLKDLREKLSKSGPPPTSTLPSQHHNMPESKGTSLLRPNPPTRTVDNVPRDSARGSYSLWEMDHVQRRSPDELLRAPRNVSPQRSMGELQRKPTLRTVDDVRPAQYRSSDIFDNSRSASSSTYMSRSMMPPGVAAKPTMPSRGQLPPPSAAVHQSSCMADEPQTVDGLLHSLGLGKYAILFKAEEIDMMALKQMGENDLKELGIPMGPRKKLLLALLPRSKRQQ